MGGSAKSGDQDTDAIDQLLSIVTDWSEDASAIENVVASIAGGADIGGKVIKHAVVGVRILQADTIGKRVASNAVVADLIGNAEVGASYWKTNAGRGLC